MSTRTYDKMPPSYTKGVQTYRWVGLGAGDDGMPAQGLAKYTRKTIEVTGTSPSVTIEGRLGTGTWKVLETISSADIRTVEENVDSIRPIVAGGTTVVVLLQVVAPNSPMLLGEDTGGGGGALTWPLLAPNGSAAAPSYSFASETGTGLFTGGGGTVLVSAAGVLSTQFHYSGITTITGLSIGATVFTPDVILARDAAGILAQKNGANPQTLRVYETYTDASNYSGIAVATTGSLNRIMSIAAGTGTDKGLRLTAPTGQVTIFGNSATVGWFFDGGLLFPNTNNTHDIGLSSVRIKDFYLSGLMNFTARTAPATPAAGFGVLYFSSVDKKFHQKDDAGVDTALF